MQITSVKDADRLLAIDVAMADKAEIQDSPGKAMTAGALEIPAGGTIDFKPGGRSLVLTGLKAPLKEGESFLVTLKFDKAGTQSLPVKVLSTSATGLPPVGSARKGDTTAAVSQP
jgi:copper(I)-binding protein